MNLQEQKMAGRCAAVPAGGLGFQGLISCRVLFFFFWLKGGALEVLQFLGVRGLGLWRYVALAVVSGTGGCALEALERT